MSDGSDTWKVERPDLWINAVRTDDAGVQHTGLVCFIASATPDGKGGLQVKCQGPETLLRGRPLPFQPPMADDGMSREPFAFHWRLLTYVFGLSDPRQFPQLTRPLSDGDQSPRGSLRPVGY